MQNYTYKLPKMAKLVFSVTYGRPLLLHDGQPLKRVDHVPWRRVDLSRVSERVDQLP